MRADIELAQLMIDPENPRMEIQPNSREALRELFRSDKTGMMELARDIAERGRISPLEKIGVYEAPGHRKRYVVGEGNRRVASMMALFNPDLLKGAISPASHARLKKLSVEFLEKDPTDVLECEILSKAELQTWMALRHTAGAGARGLLRWGPKEQQRFLERSGSQKAPEMQFLDFYTDYTRGNDEEADRAKRVPLSTIKRLLESTDVRKRLGIQVSDEGVALSHYPADETFKWLRKVVHDLAEKIVTSRNLNSTKQMLEYVETFSEHELPNKEKALSEPSPVEPLAKAPSHSNKTTKKPKPRPWSIRQIKLRPVKQRLRDMVEELEQIKIENAPNVHGILLRVLVELATDDYLGHFKVTAPKSKGGDSTLKEKVNAAAADLKTRGKISNNELTVIQKMTAKTGLHSTHTLHQFVHNEAFHPAPSDIETLWKNLATYLVRMQER